MTSSSSSVTARITSSDSGGWRTPRRTSLDPTHTVGPEGLGLNDPAVQETLKNVTKTHKPTGPTKHVDEFPDAVTTTEKTEKVCCTIL